MKTKITSTLKLGLLFGLSTLLFTSCQKDEVLPATAPVSSGVLIANQGQFTKNNASLSLLDLSNNSINLDVFASNNSEQLGDIAQSVTEIDGKIYVVVNNSGKIVKLNKGSFKKEGVITGLTSPRYLAPASSGKAYVSDLFSGKISVVNLVSNTVTKTIACEGWTEEMVSKDGKTYVTNNSSSYLYIINHSTDAISDSILVGEGASSLAFDANGKLWIAFGQLYDETFNPIENGKIKKINTASKSVELNLTVANGGADKIRMNAAKDAFFYLNQGAQKMSVNSNTLPSTPFYTKSGITISGLGYDVIKNELYIANAGDYVTPGQVIRINATGTEMNTYTVGVVPGEFYFLSK